MKKIFLILLFPFCLFSQDDRKLQSLDTVNQNLRKITLPVASVITATTLTAANIIALLTVYNTWKTNNPTRTPLRVEIVSPSAALREMFLEYK